MTARGIDQAARGYISEDREFQGSGADPMTVEAEA